MLNSTESRTSLHTKTFLMNALGSSMQYIDLIFECMVAEEYILFSFPGAVGQSVSALAINDGPS